MRMERLIQRVTADRMYYLSPPIRLTIRLPFRLKPEAVNEVMVVMVGILIHQPGTLQPMIVNSLIYRRLKGGVLSSVRSDKEGGM